MRRASPQGESVTVSVRLLRSGVGRVGHFADGGAKVSNLRNAYSTYSTHSTDSTCPILCAMRPASSLFLTLATLAAADTIGAAQAPADPHRRFHTVENFRLESGVVLPRAVVAYATFGTLNAGRTNAVLIPSWYGSDHHGYDFLIGPGRALDPANYFIVATEMFANGFSSSPSSTSAPF